MSKKKITALEKKNCQIRLLEEKDLEQLRQWRNQDHIRSCFVNKDIISAEQQQKWWAGYKDREDDYVFIIEEIEEGLGPVGAISLYHIDWDNKRAEYGRLMLGEPKARGKGLARTASELVLLIAFELFLLDEVYLEVYADNQPAIKVYEACGFEQTGLEEGLLKMKIVRDK
jgi:RimJ/RimL family protein N-acetyltransferase